MFAEFQDQIRKHTTKIVRFVNRAGIVGSECIRVLDALRDGDATKQSKVLKQAAERCLRRITPVFIHV